MNKLFLVGILLAVATFSYASEETVSQRMARETRCLLEWRGMSFQIECTLRGKRLVGRLAGHKLARDFSENGIVGTVNVFRDDHQKERAFTIAFLFKDDEKALEDSIVLDPESSGKLTRSFPELGEVEVSDYLEIPLDVIKSYV